LKGVERFQPVSIGYLAKVINTPVRPLALKKNRHFDVKYQLTNEIINNLKHENEHEIEKSFEKLVNKGKIVQSVKGYPKRYSVRVHKTDKDNSSSESFDDDRLDMDVDEYDEPEVTKSLFEGFIQTKKLHYPTPVV